VRQKRVEKDQRFRIHVFTSTNVFFEPIPPKNISRRFHRLDACGYVAAAFAFLSSYVLQKHWRWKSYTKLWEKRLGQLKRCSIENSNATLGADVTASAESLRVEASL
jgi:hypothetical protein